MTYVSIAFQISVALTVFWAGLGTSRDDLAYVFRRPRLLLTSLLAMFVVMPVVALAIEVYFDFPHAARVAIVVLALSPIPQLLPRTTLASGGHHAFAYGLAFSVSLLSVVIVPAMISFLGKVMGRPFGVDPTTVWKTVALTVLLPLALGMLTRRVSPRLADRSRDTVGRVGNTLMMLAIVALLVIVGRAVLEVANLKTLLAMSLFVVTGLVIGHVLGGPERDHSVVLAIACANRNPGIAIGIATANFPAESFGATIILYALLIGIVTKPYVRRQQRLLAPPPAAEAATSTDTTASAASSDPPAAPSVPQVHTRNTDAPRGEPDSH